MKKLPYKEAQPLSENDYLDIEQNWYSIDPSRKFFRIMDKTDWRLNLRINNDFRDWAFNNCEGRWYRVLQKIGIEVLYFQNESDRIKFILRFM